MPQVTKKERTGMIHFKGSEAIAQGGWEIAADLESGHTITSQGARSTPMKPETIQELKNMTAADLIELQKLCREGMINPVNDLLKTLVGSGSLAECLHKGRNQEREAKPPVKFLGEVPPPVKFLRK